MIGVVKIPQWDMLKSIIEHSIAKYFQKNSKLNQKW